MPAPGTAAYDEHQAHRARKASRGAQNAQLLFQGGMLGLQALGQARDRATQQRQLQLEAEYATGARPLTQEGLQQQAGSYEVPTLPERIGQMFTAPFGGGPAATEQLDPVRVLSLERLRQIQEVEAAKEGQATLDWRMDYAKRVQDFEVKKAEEQRAAQKFAQEQRGQRLMGTLTQRMAEAQSPQQAYAVARAAARAGGDHGAALQQQAHELLRQRNLAPEQLLKRQEAAASARDKLSGPMRSLVISLRHGSEDSVDTLLKLQRATVASLMASGIAQMGNSDVQGLGERMDQLMAEISQTSDPAAREALETEALTVIRGMQYDLGRQYLESHLVAEHPYAQQELPPRLAEAASEAWGAVQQWKASPSVMAREAVNRELQELWSVLRKNQGYEVPARLMWGGRFGYRLQEAVEKGARVPEDVEAFAWEILQADAAFASQAYR